MTREEAIRRIKEWNLDADDMEVLSEVIPELKESEDERMIGVIRLALTDVPEERFTTEGTSLSKVLAWIEKQKESPKSADSIPSDCVSDAKCENRWHKVKESLPDNPREVLCKDAIGNFFIGRYYKESGSWEVSMYDDVDKSNEDNPPVIMWCDIPSENQRKPDGTWTEEDDAKVKAMCKEGNLKPSEIAWLKELKNRIVKKEQKPVEWSEEDEKKIHFLSRLIELQVKNTEYCFSKGYFVSKQEAIEMLKSLRPQPKKELSIEKAIKWLDDTFYFLDNSSGRGRDCEITTHDFDSLEEMYDSFRKAVIVDSEPHWKPTEEQKPEAKLTGWVARDGDERIWVYETCPKKYSEWLEWVGNDGYMSIDQKSFPDLKWEDEPVEVEITIREK